MKSSHIISSLEAMLRFGERLGRALRGGEVFELVGDIGSGKTSFVKGLARGLAITEVIQSPTFTISRVYKARDGLTLFHYDFYRLPKPGIMRDELAESLADTTGIVALEWDETVRDLLPAERTVRLELRSSSGETKRAVQLNIPPKLEYVRSALKGSQQ